MKGKKVIKLTIYFTIILTMSFGLFNKNIFAKCVLPDGFENGGSANSLKEGNIYKDFEYTNLFRYLIIKMRKKEH